MCYSTTVTNPDFGEILPKTCFWEKRKKNTTNKLSIQTKKMKQQKMRMVNKYHLNMTILWTYAQCQIVYDPLTFCFEVPKVDGKKIREKMIDYSWGEKKPSSTAA